MTFSREQQEKVQDFLIREVEKLARMSANHVEFQGQNQKVQMLLNVFYAIQS
jgi:hypothetical protein